MRKFIIAAVLALGTTSLVSAPVFAGDKGGDKKAEMKCDKTGKACEKGDDCKADNCKQEKK